MLSGPAGTGSEPTRRLLQLLQELHGPGPSGHSPPALVSPQVSYSGAQLPPALGHAQVSAPPGLGSCLGGSAERANNNVTYSTPETTELKPTATVGHDQREPEGGPKSGPEAHGDDQDEVIDNYDDLAKLPSFFSRMGDASSDDALE